MRIGVLLVAVVGFSVTLRGADAPAKGDDVDRWIKQLGARRHREREAAGTALVKQRSPKAIALLRQAAAGGDLDTSRKAQELLVLIERALESERLLQPQTIRLEFKDVPVADALADFVRRTGIRALLAESDKVKLAKRTVTLDTGEVGYWEALSQLCLKAGLADEPAKAVPFNQYEYYEEDFRWRRRMMWRHSYSYYPQQQRTDLILVDGKTQRPTFNAGALRIQAMPKLPLVGPPAPTGLLTIGVDVEPRFNFSRLVSVRIEQAVDQFGQKLQPPAMFVGDVPRQPQMWDEMVVVWDGPDYNRQPTNPRQGDVKLVRGDRPAWSLKELRGTLSAEVETPATPLLTVADILKTGGQTFQGPDGAAVRVLEAVPDTDQYRLKIEVKLPPPPPVPHNPWGGVVQVVPEGGSVNLNSTDAEQNGLALYDEQGQPYILATGSYTHTGKPGAPRTYTLFYQPRKEQGPPSKFVLSGRRTVVLEVPFVLKDVPLR